MAAASGVRGCVLKTDITDPSNYRATRDFDQWLKARGIIGIAGIDTRALTSLIRNQRHAERRDRARSGRRLRPRPAPGRGQGMARTGRHGPRPGGDHRPDATTGTRPRGSGSKGYGRLETPRHQVVAVDYGIKRNILRLLADHGCRVTVLPATATGEEILAHKPDGVFLSNGPGDPAATGDYAVPAIRQVIESGTPTFGICLGHQMLGLALGANTVKMHQGHHGANHPVKDLTTGKVEITSMNHGFAVDSRDAARRASRRPMSRCSTARTAACG